MVKTALHVDCILYDQDGHPGRLGVVDLSFELRADRLRLSGRPSLTACRFSIRVCFLSVVLLVYSHFRSFFFFLLKVVDAFVW